MSDILFGFADPVLLGFTLFVGLLFRGQQRVALGATLILLYGAGMVALSYDHPDATGAIMAKLFDAGVVLGLCMLFVGKRAPEIDDRQR